MDKNKRSIVVVLGMHRSGSSAITRGLQVMGVTLGDQLIGPQPANPKGFWEDIDINALDMEMLSALHLDWHSLTPVGMADVEALRDQGYFARATDLVRRKAGDSALFGFKDPRVTKLLPFWNEVFHHCDFNISYVLTLRHPRSVVDSLARRDGFDEVKSYLLWLGHVLSSLSGTVGQNRILVDYDRLMQRPDQELSRIAKCIGEQINPSKLQCYKTEFLDERLRHTTYSADEIGMAQTCPLQVRELYPALLDIASDKRSIDDEAFNLQLVGWVREFERTKLQLALADRLGVQKQSIKKIIAQQDGQIGALSGALAARDDQIAEMARLGLQRDWRIAELENTVGMQNKETAKRDAQIDEFRAIVAERDKRIDALLNSTSWRITAPVRFLRRLIRASVSTPRAVQVARGIYLRLPFSNRIRWRLKSVFFYVSGPLLRHTEPYRIWASSRASKSTPRGVESAPPSKASGSRYARLYSALFDQAAGTRGVALDYVPEAVDTLADSKLDLQLIAFYLPQFHPIAENDEWWGKGFTEWTNVSKAVPQFEGHYQPHLPGDLGFYDLRLIEVMRRQVELARRYGLRGFCFHYYWFNGRKLLDRPIEQYLAHPELSLPFCICWANENWTRRWDGSEDETLITQQHTPESDNAFIRDVAPMFADARYIRVDGKPVLVVYRVSLLPDAAGTMRRWRQYCRDHGFGEIYVVVAQSFDVTDPKRYGADAAVEFPPHQVNVGEIGNQLVMLNTHFQGKVYDYKSLSIHFCSKPETDYVLHRTVTPGWDNEARKPGRGHCFHHSSPSVYADWLSHVCRETVTRYPKNQRLVFVNAWNEWAEGAHLEPDRRYGYAYLHATANVLREHSGNFHDIDQTLLETQTRFSRSSDVAIVAHLYYLDWLDELVAAIAKSPIDLDVFVSLRADVKPQELAAVRAALPNAYLIRAGNRGRDWQPFLQMLPLLQHFGYVAACKIHSKKSLHLNEGDSLRKRLLKVLMSPDQVLKIACRFRDEPRLGLVAPAHASVSLAKRDRHVLNMQWLDRLLLKLGAESQIGKYQFDFVAGSMFWFRPAAMLKFSEFMLSESDFERELGQVDGTLAHALERLALFITQQAGYISEEEGVIAGRQTERCDATA